MTIRPHMDIALFVDGNQSITRMTLLECRTARTAGRKCREAIMRPIGEIIKAVVEVGDNPIPADIRDEIIMYLEMLHDLMNDTSYYFFNYAKHNLKQR